MSLLTDAITTLTTEAQSAVGLIASLQASIAARETQITDLTNQLASTGDAEAAAIVAVASSLTDAVTPPVPVPSA